MTSLSNHTIDIQVQTTAPHPNEAQLQDWAQSALQQSTPFAAEVAVTLVDADTSQNLNRQYRQKDKPTNVLSFPCDMPIYETPKPLGDIIICNQVVNTEAQQQHKTQDAHWAHMIIHGILHLIGYDHQNDEDAAIMENKEIAILASLNFPNPYLEEHDTE